MADAGSKSFGEPLQTFFGRANASIQLRLFHGGEHSFEERTGPVSGNDQVTRLSRAAPTAQPSAGRNQTANAH
ncbi:MAG: hypothetical protein ACLP1Y_02760 [Candidatus Acidiferrales bacterium]